MGDYLHSKRHKCFWKSTEAEECCDTSYNRKPQLRWHIHGHMRIYPYKCKWGCDKKFNNKNSWERHEGVHQKWQCPECPEGKKRFSVRKANLVRHLKDRHNYTPVE